jgi:predicted P-loop ATPase
MSINIVAHFNPNGIPDYLKLRPQWIVWGKRTKKYKNELLENGKLNRIPYDPRTGKVANSNDPTTWGTFNDAWKACQSAWYNGIGFWQSENDGLVGITLNHCFVPGTRILIPEAKQIVARFGATFAESFPSGDESGDGLHIYCFGFAPHCGPYEHAPWIESYGRDISGHGTNHYFCVTGNQFSKTLEITNCQTPLTWLYDSFNAPTPPVTRPPKAPPQTPSNEELSCLSEFDLLKAFNEQVSNVLFARKDSQKDQLFKSALVLSELCKSPWAARLITRKTIEKALLKVTRFPYKTAHPIIASAFETADGTRETPTSFEKHTPPQPPQNLNSKQQDTNWQAKPDTNRQAKPDTNRQAKPDTNRQAKPDTSRQAKPDTSRQAKPDTNRQAKPDTNRQAKPDTNWQAELTHKTIGNSVIPSRRNLEQILEHDEQWRGVLGYNEFTRKTVKMKNPPYRLSELGEWQDTDDINTAIWLEKHYNLITSPQKVSDVIKIIAQHHKFHPVRDYLTERDWDGKPRVDRWLNVYLGVLDTEYARLVGKTWLISAVARILEPGCKVDNVLILEGEQGLYKSTALRLLCQDDSWFNDTPFDLGSKDAFLTITGKWIIELAELDSFNKANSARAKAFFSSPVDTYREPYARNTVSVPRQCVFAGSVNKETYLKDETGNRRYLPVECTSIDLVGIKAARDQLWAEAYQMYMNGEQWWTNANFPFIKEQQEARFEVDIWESTLVKYLDGTLPSPNEATGTNSTDNKPPVPTPKNEVTLTQLLAEALQIPIDKQDRRVQSRVGSILKKLGWRRKRRRNGSGGREYVYCRMKNEK